MKLVGHVRYAYLALLEAKKHLNAMAEILMHDPLETPEGNIFAGAATGGVWTAASDLRKVLEPLEALTHNDNGETALEWAEEARAAHGRFLHCFAKLGESLAGGIGAPPIPRDCLDELASWRPRLDLLVRLLEEKERKR